MAKRKKSKSQSKSLSPRLQEAQHRKAYIKKMISTAEAIGIGDLELMVSQEELNYLFDLRIKIIPLAAASPDLSMTALKETRAVFDYLLVYCTMSFYENGPEFTVRDAFTYLHNLYYYFNLSYNVKPSDILKQKSAQFLKDFENEHSPYSRLSEVAWAATLHISDMGNRLAWITHEFAIEDVRLCHRFHLHTERPEQKKVKINDIVRTVYRVGTAYPSHGPMWLDIDKSLFESKLPKGKKMLPVYVQSHALHRIEERLDALGKGLGQTYLYYSLEKPVIVKNCEGRKLIEYRYNGFKLGYLVADIIGEILVIRTFLFVTMDSTPEGKILQEALGLEAVDKQYLAIDRLSTFLNSDIADHPDVKAHFVNAGCEDLFNITFDTMEAKEQIETGQFIRAYLEKNRSIAMPIPETMEEAQLQHAFA